MSLFGMTIGKDSKFKQSLHDAGFGEDLVTRLVDDPHLASWWVNALREKLVPAMFVSPEQQLSNVLNRFGYFFLENQIESARQAIPEFHAHGLTTSVLVPHFNNVEQTFNWLWSAVADTHKSNWRWDGLKSDPGHLLLLGGIEFTPSTLTWQIIDFGANRNRKPGDVRGSDSPSAGCLAAAWHHPDWFQSMNGNDVPYICLPGYEMTTQRSKPWHDVPYLYCVDGEVRLDTYWEAHANQYRAVAVPVLREL